MPIKTKKRDESIDAMKFVLISLVILDHCAVKFKLSTAPCYEHFYQLAQAINMPIFVFISGYFMRRGAEARKFYKGVLSILETYVVFQIPNYLLCVLLKGDYSLWNLFNPAWAMWYLPALIVWRVVAYVVPDKIVSNKPLVLTSLFTISLLGGFIPSVSIFQRIITYAPMFFIGFYSSKTTILSSIRKIHPLVPIVILLSYFIFLFISNIHTSVLFYQNHSYSAERVSLTNAFLYRIIWHIVTLIIGASAASLLLRIKNKKMAELGMHTLLFYVGHLLFLTVLGLFFVKWKLLRPDPLLVLAVFSVIIIFFSVLSRYSWHKYILNPVTTYIEKH